ncbi:hypothetical protein KKB44_01690 [Candidatus Micrarchaeota archaeon]|nr:hypothetical protein [Candidatus Micrarchaeota archaeon]
MRGHGMQVSRFGAKSLEPLIDEAMRDGIGLHIIHDAIPSFPVIPDIKIKFEKMVKNRKVMRVWNSQDREWKLQTKRKLSAADRGEETEQFNPRQSPEARIILAVNSTRPYTITNHLAFYPLEAAVEKTRFAVNMVLAQEKLEQGNVKAAVEHIVEAFNALASSNLLVDTDLAKQIRELRRDVVVLRTLNHVYLRDLAECKIPVFANGRLIDFDALMKEHDIEITADVEPLEMTFSEQAINSLCVGEIEPETVRMLSLLEMFFVNYMHKFGSWQDPKSVQQGILHALAQYNEVPEKAQGHA